MIRKRKNSIYDSKKGFVQGIVMIVIGLALFGIIGLAGYQIFSEVNDDIQASDMQPIAKNQIGDLHNRYPSTIDGAFLTVMVLMWILAMVAGYQADNNPLYLVVIILMMIFLLIGAGFMSNVWEDIASDDEFVEFADYFPFINFILQNFLLVSGVVAASVMGIMFMRSRV